MVPAVRRMRVTGTPSSNTKASAPSSSIRALAGGVGVKPNCEMVVLRLKIQNGIYAHSVASGVYRGQKIRVTLTARDSVVAASDLDEVISVGAAYASIVTWVGPVISWASHCLGYHRRHRHQQPGRAPKIKSRYCEYDCSYSETPLGIVFRHTWRGQASFIRCPHLRNNGSGILELCKEKRPRSKQGRTRL